MWQTGHGDIVGFRLSGARYRVCKHVVNMRQAVWYSCTTCQCLAWKRLYLREMQVTMLVSRYLQMTQPSSDDTSGKTPDPSMHQGAIRHEGIAPRHGRAAGNNWYPGYIAETF